MKRSRLVRLAAIATLIPSAFAAAAPAAGFPVSLAPARGGAPMLAAAAHAVPAAWGRALPLCGVRPGGARGLEAAARVSGALPAAAGRSAVTSVPDGAGGTYVAWEDARDGVTDIYLLRVTNAGAVASGWPASGLAVCSAPGAQFGPILVSNGSDGVIVAWQDLRDNWFGGDGWAQRVSGAGVVQWAANGVKVGSGFAQAPSIAPDGSGGMLVAWSAGTPADIYALRINSTGAVPAGWSASGTLVCSAGDEQLNPVIVPDGGGGAIVAWEDFRSGTGDSHIYAQRLNASAAAQWTADGLQLDAAGYANDPAIIPDGTGGAMLAWWEYSAQGLVRGQRIDRNGSLQWAGGADLSGSLVGAQSVSAAFDGLGGMVATWSSPTFINSRLLISQRVNATGTVQWGASGATVATFTLTETADPPEVAPDGAGGAYYAWSVRTSTTGAIQAQRVASNGAVSWGASGVTVKSGIDASLAPAVAEDGSGGALLCWPELDDLGLVTIVAQRYNVAGAPQLGSGAVVFSDPGIQSGAATVSDGSGGAWVAWTDKRAGQYDVRARHVMPGGVSTGPTIAIATGAGNQFLAAAISDGAGGLIAAWNDHGGADHDIYAQRLDASGAALWGPGGVAVCAAAQNQDLSSMVSDGSGGAILAWADWRNVDGTGNLDIFAQRIAAAGSPQWGANGLGVCTDLGYQDTPHAVPDGSGGAIVVWNDNRGSSPAAYGQHVNSAGSPQWAADGISLAALDDFTSVAGAVSDGAGGAILLASRYAIPPAVFQIDSTAFYAFRVDGSGSDQWGRVIAYYHAGFSFLPMMVSDGAGGALIAWGDGRSGPFDVYLQRITSAGGISFGAAGTPVCTAASWQWPSGLFATGSGDATVAWSDERAGSADVYVQRITSGGTPAWTADGVALCGAARGQYGVSAANDDASGGLFAWTDDRDGIERLIYTQRVNALGAPQWTGGGVVDVAVSLVSASALPGRVAIEWQMRGSEAVTVYRSRAGAAWEPVARLAADPSGRLRFEDRDVVAGARFGYRIGVFADGHEALGGEVWLEVPAAVSFDLRAPSPNPGSGPMRVAFSLATGEAARLELLDVAGRVVLTRGLEGFGPGSHVLTLERGLPRAGLYFLRLTQGGRAEVRRTVRVR